MSCKLSSVSMVTRVSRLLAVLSLHSLIHVSFSLSTHSRVALFLHHFTRTFNVPVYVFVRVAHSATNRASYHCILLMFIYLFSILFTFSFLLKALYPVQRLSDNILKRFPHRSPIP